MTKRSRDVELDMATCLMLLSGVGQDMADAETDESAKLKRLASDWERVFTCKTCDRQFSSFQALGGHRASHKKPRQTEAAESPVVKAKAHECSICGVEFAIGQALGGHMRKHRNAVVSGERFEDPAPVAVMKRCGSGKRVVCLDLNLTPLENDLNLHLGLVL